MNIGIAGLGLIGGSFAKAYKKAGISVYGYDGNRVMEDFAQLDGTLVGHLDEATIPLCDLILVALYPEDSMAYLRQIAPLVSPTTLVMDCCGVKEKICQLGFQLAEEYGFSFVGGHPMAGTQFSGYVHSSAQMFEDCSMIIVPPVGADIQLLDRVKSLLSPVGFTSLPVATAQHHDEMIAYTSQMCHVVSNAFVKSPAAQHHRGYSAGSYHDLTRVAWLNEHMWSDLFLENKTALLSELDILIHHLGEYREALDTDNRTRLTTLLAEGRICKERVDTP